MAPAINRCERRVGAPFPQRRDRRRMFDWPGLGRVRPTKTPHRARVDGRTSDTGKPVSPVSRRNDDSGSLAAARGTPLDDLLVDRQLALALV